MTIRGSGDLQTPMASAPPVRLGPLLGASPPMRMAASWSGSPGSHRIQGCGANTLQRPIRRAPLGSFAARTRSLSPCEIWCLTTKSLAQGKGPRPRGDRCRRLFQLCLGARAASRPRAPRRATRKRASGLDPALTPKRGAVMPLSTQPCRIVSILAFERKQATPRNCA